MKVLILGGTGAIGRHLVKYLAQLGKDDVYVTSRGRYADFENIHYLQGNPHDITFLDCVLSSRWDSIVDFMVYSFDELPVILPKYSKATEQYVFLSSARVYSNSEIIDEKTPQLIDTITDADFLNTNDYSLRKSHAEKLIKSLFNSNYTIIRPYITYDQHRLQLGILEKERWLYRAINQKTVVVYGDCLNNWTSLTYGKDVGYCIGKLLGKKEAIGEEFNIVNPVPIKWGDVLNIYFDVIEEKCGFRPKYKVVDLKEGMSGYYGWKYDRAYDRVFSSKNLFSVIGDFSFESTESTIKRMLMAFLNSPSFLRINYGSEGFFDRITGERIPLTMIPGTKNLINYLFSRYIKSFKL